MRRFLAALSGFVLVGTLVTTGIAGADTSTSTNANRTCDEGRWPVSVQGQPQSFQVGGPAGYYIWHNEQGWHLRTTTPSTEGHSFTGTIRSSAPIHVVREFRGERNDYVVVHDNVLSFRFDTHSQVDGVDFTVGCTEGLRFDLYGEGHQWPAARIWLGYRGNAPSNPFSVSRRG